MVGIGDTVKMTEGALREYSPVVAAHYREIRWRVLDRDADGSVKLRQIGGSGLVSWVNGEDYERADAG